MTAPYLDNTMPHPKPVSQARRGNRLNPPRSNPYHWHLTALRRELEQVIKECLTDKNFATLVDFGCGSAPYRPLFEPFVRDYIGCDLPQNTDADRTMSVEGRLPFEDASVDLVLSSQVLEHVSDPGRYLAEAYRVLDADGLLILSTHGVWRYHPDPTDFWRWTCDGLKLQLERAGFEVVRFAGVMGPQATSLQIWQDAVQERVPNSLRRYFFAFLQWRMKCADFRCPREVLNKDAAVYVAVCRPA